MTSPPTIHASAVLIGARAALVRGPAGSGKSRLVFDLLQAAQAGQLPFARLVADDRVHLQACHGRLLARPAPVLAGLLEVRGIGMRQVAHEPLAVVGVVVDLAAADAVRLPLPESSTATLEGIVLPRLAVASGSDALPLLLALRYSPGPS